VRDILIVDDPQNLPAGLQDKLWLNGHRVFFAPNGEAAITELNSYKPDLIICNITSFQINGILLLFHLLRTGITIPRIALVGKSKYEPEYFIEMSLALKAKHVLFKPVTIESLLKAILEMQE
jgi:two-component system response regulator